MLFPYLSQTCSFGKMIFDFRLLTKNDKMEETTENQTLRGTLWLVQITDFHLFI